jgi:hypothetical protein
MQVTGESMGQFGGRGEVFGRRAMFGIGDDGRNKDMGVRVGRCLGQVSGNAGISGNGVERAEAVIVKSTTLVDLPLRHSMIGSGYLPEFVAVSYE